jgi:hypothetical protein
MESDVRNTVSSFATAQLVSHILHPMYFQQRAHDSVNRSRFHELEINRENSKRKICVAHRHGGQMVLSIKMEVLMKAVGFDD